MKQFITIEQLEELNEKQKNNLSVWYHDHSSHVDQEVETDIPRHNLPLLSIGQMIEFLDEVEGNSYIDVSYGIDAEWRNIGPITLWDSDKKENLCDSLWKAVKEALEK